MPVSTRLNGRRSSPSHGYSLRPAPAAGFYAEHVDDETVDADVRSAADALISMRSPSAALQQQQEQQQQPRRSSRLASRN